MKSERSHARNSIEPRHLLVSTDIHPDKIIKEMENSDYHQEYDDRIIINILSNVNLSQKIHSTCILYLAAKGKIALLNQYYFKIQFYEKDNFKRTIALVAAMHGQVEVLQWIIDNTSNYIIGSLHLTTISFLRDRNLKNILNDKDMTGRNITLLAIYYGHDNVLKWLKQREKKIFEFSFNVKDDQGQGPIEVAIAGKQLTMLQLLMTPIAEGGYGLPLDLCNQTNIIKYAIEAGSLNILQAMQTTLAVNGSGIQTLLNPFYNCVFWSVIHNQFTIFKWLISPIEEGGLYLREELNLEINHLILIAMLNNNRDILNELSKCLMQVKTRSLSLSDRLIDIFLTGLFNQPQYSHLEPSEIFLQAIDLFCQHYVLDHTDKGFFLSFDKIKSNFRYAKEKIEIFLLKLIDVINKVCCEDIEKASLCFNIVKKLSLKHANDYISIGFQEFDKDHFMHQPDKGKKEISDSDCKKIQWLMLTNFNSILEQQGLFNALYWVKRYKDVLSHHGLIDIANNPLLLNRYQELIEMYLTHPQYKNQAEATRIVDHMELDESIKPCIGYVMLAQTYAAIDQYDKVFDIYLKQFNRNPLKHYGNPEKMKEELEIKINAGYELAHLIYNGFVSLDCQGIVDITLTHQNLSLTEEERHTQENNLITMQKRVVHAYEYVSITYENFNLKIAPQTKFFITTLYQRFQAILAGKLEHSIDHEQNLIWTAEALEIYFNYYTNKNPMMLAEKGFVKSQQAYYRERAVQKLAYQQLLADNQKLVRENELTHLGYNLLLEKDKKQSYLSQITATFFGQANENSQKEASDTVIEKKY